MSWVDLAALSIMLWGAAQGYLNGPLTAIIRLLGSILAVLMAFFLVNPLAVYVQNEWQLEAIFVDWFQRTGKAAILVTQAGEQYLNLPTAAAPLLRKLVPELAASPVSGAQEALVPLLAALAVRILILSAALIFILAVIRVFTQIKAAAASSNQPEWQRLLGLVVGSADGLFFALLTCVALDAFSLLVYPTLIQGDLTSSYLWRAANYLIN
ncbi:MAG TPA: hypothetical protein VFC74_03885 [Oscillospiraceae bacterium]|nr:hypothetical protein [Oscillospiraceae bacterium]